MEKPLPKQRVHLPFILVEIPAGDWNVEKELYEEQTVRISSSGPVNLLSDLHVLSSLQITSQITAQNIADLVSQNVYRLIEQGPRKLRLAAETPVKSKRP